MIRKISAKAANNDDKLRKQDLKTSDNEYYLPHPQVRIVKTPNKQSSFDHQKDKHFIKYNKKNTHNVPQRTYSTTNFKFEVHNLSKEYDQLNHAKNHLTKKVQSRKLRCTSNVETPRKASSKSGLKINLNSMKKDGGVKRLNLKIETPTTKKSEKLNTNTMNFDNYYNNECPSLQFKTARALKRPESTHSHISNNYQYAMMFNRCKKIVEEYKEQLEQVKSENRLLQEENQKLKHQTSLKKE